MTKSARRTCLPWGDLLLFLGFGILLTAGSRTLFLDPSFWLDEAFVAESLKEFSWSGIWGPLPNGQQFPRALLSLIGLMRTAFGYETHVLRFIPWLSFVASAVLAASLLRKAIQGRWQLSIWACAFLSGSTFWILYGSQFKQYSTDLFLALIPFALSDAFLDRRLSGRRPLTRRLTWLFLLSAPSLLSYPYSLVWAGRFTPYFLHRTRRSNLLPALGIQALFAAALWWFDLRFSREASGLSDYWRSCVLSERWRDEGWIGAIRLMLNSIWGWEAHLPRAITAGVAVLQLLGVAAIIRRMRAGDLDSRAWGSLAVLAAFPLASAVAGFPICCGRLTLPLQIHTQGLAIVGAATLLAWTASRRPALRLATNVSVTLLACGALFFSVKEGARWLLTHPEEDLRPLLKELKPDRARAVYVQACSLAQVRALPEGIGPLKTILGDPARIPRGEPVYLIWTHLTPGCAQEIEGLKKEALHWEILNEGPARSLVLMLLEPNRSR